MRIGICLAISGLVLASIIITAAGVHLLWWRTAEANSHALAATIDEQIVSAVQKEVDSITTQARAAHTAIRTLFVQNVLETREADKREFVFLSQLQAQPSISWVAFGWPDDAFFAAHKLGDLGLEMMEIGKVDGVVKRRVDEYRVVVGDIEFQKRRFENTDYKVTDQEWYKKSIAEDEPSWFEVSAFPVGLRPSIAYAGPIDVYQKRQGVLAVIIENTRLAQFLSQLSVGKTGAAFILGRDGAVIAAPDPDADEVHMQRHDQRLLPVAQMALKETGTAAGSANDKSRRMRMVTAGEGYAVTLTALDFAGWTLATVIPEEQYVLLCAYFLAKYVLLWRRRHRGRPLRPRRRRARPVQPAPAARAFVPGASRRAAARRGRLHELRRPPVLRQPARDPRGARAPRRAARAPVGRRATALPHAAGRRDACCARAAASTTRRSPARATSSPTTTSPSWFERRAGPGVPADLARHAAQAARLRRLGDAQDQARLRAPLGRSRSATGSTCSRRTASRRRSCAAPTSSRARCSRPAIRATTSSRGPDRDARPRALRERLGHPGGRAHGALRADVPRPRPRPPRPLPARPARSTSSACARRSGDGHRDPVPQAPLRRRPGPGDRGRLRARRVELPRRRPS